MGDESGMIDDACSRFEAAWQTGQQPRIEDFLPAETPDISRVTLREILVSLVGIDLEWRWKKACEPGLQETVAKELAGNDVLPLRPRLSDYVARYPLLGPVEQLPCDLIVDEYYARRRYGDRPTHAEYLDVVGSFHPELAKQLQAIDDRMVSDLLDPSSESLPGTRLWQPGAESRQIGNDTTPRQPQPAADASDGHPDRIGRYRIERVLGEGAFGRVYRGFDDELKRPVAIKVPHRKLVDKPEDIDLYLEEAQVVASLDHANIVPVHDVGRTDDGLCYVVSKFIQGSDLAKRIKGHRLSHCESAGLVAAIAEALHHAHLHMVVHRDVKPANILIETTGKPYLADFGLALKEEDFGSGSGVAGTAAYMSPEQARGEGHLVDGRADIFSLGVVFYELLTASRPFWGDNRAEVIERIRSLEARPPRQLDDTIPRELERICLKALTKRASDRYTTALDMAEDLRHFLAQTAEAKPVDPAKVEVQLVAPAGATPAPPSPAGLDSGKPLKIVPKGLRSFDAQDADFFLELLPGPRDRDGLPESIRFWKHRIEETDAERTFRVGLIYGPSGCGKSSLVKAGLLPRLAGHVLSIYVEATADDTEARLLRGLRKQCPGLQENLGLKESIAALRRRRGIPAGKKVLIVLDQFEQWLHAKPSYENLELVEALRHCDGERVQCIVMVRDDFWMAATRFMQQLEVRLLENHNSAAVDLFPIHHAEKVLTAFGRAFGTLPEKSADTTKEQKQFIEQAVAGLADDGKVVCVRLALFAEMMKGKPWTPAALKEVGGTEGVGVTFLEETFSASTAPPDHRYHQKAARAVLKALLPDSGTDIKGHMRSYAELLAASGYLDRPTDFGDLIGILDGEIRLITPTDPEGKEEADPSNRGLLERSGYGNRPNRSDDVIRIPDSEVRLITPTDPEGQAKAEHLPSPSGRGAGGEGERYYQLTHDYLVPSLRDWLTRKQRETRKGRAELRLVERSALWNAKPENQQLPSLWEFLNIRLLTGKKNWTDPQRKMMGRAGRVHGIRSGIVAAMLLVASIVGVSVRHAVVEKQNATRAEGLVDALVNADIAKVPDIVTSLEDYRAWADPLLKAKFDHAKEGSSQRLNMALALLPADEAQVEYLYARLLDAAPNEVPVIRDALAPHQDTLLKRLWAVVEAPDKGKESQRLRAAAALAKYDPDNQRWGKTGTLVDNDLVLENPVFLGQWSEVFRPVKNQLLPRLSEIFRDHQPERTAERSVATNLLSDYAADRPDVLADLVMDTDEKQFAVIYPKLKERGEEGLPLLQDEIKKPLPAITEEAKEILAKRQANAAVVLLKMNHADKVWPLLKHSPDPREPSYDPRVRSYLIHSFAPLAADVTAFVRRLDEEPDISSRRALILCLGEYDTAQFPIAERQPLIAKLLDIYQNDPDPGLHGAVEWLLRQKGWGQGAQLAKIDAQLRVDEKQLHARMATEKRHWYVNSEGQTFVILNTDKPFLMGSPDGEPDREYYEVPHQQRIGRTFAIASKVVTKAQFRHFQKANPGVEKYDIEQYSRTDDSPQTCVDWYDAARYCNWLSEIEGIPKEQWCYEPNDDGKYAEGMKPAADYLQRSGYRLPTEAEWEYACRSGSQTSRYYGLSVKLLPKYAWFLDNSDNRMWPVGMKKPNDYGLFDMLGNAWQWCDNGYKNYAVAGDGSVSEDTGNPSKVGDKISRVLRGGSFNNQASDVRSAYRLRNRPGLRVTNDGFRPARTYN